MRLSRNCCDRACFVRWKRGKSFRCRNLSDQFLHSARSQLECFQPSTSNTFHLRTNRNVPRCKLGASLALPFSPILEQCQYRPVTHLSQEQRYRRCCEETQELNLGRGHCEIFGSDNGVLHNQHNGKCVVAEIKASLRQGKYTSTASKYFATWSIHRHVTYPSVQACVYRHSFI